MTGPAVPLTAPPNYTELLGEQTPTAPKDDNPYLDVLKQQTQQSGQQIKQSVAVASQRGTPERWAKVLEMSQNTKLPTDVVDRNYDELTAADDRNSPDHNDIAHETPAVGQWLHDPDNATLGRREIPALQSIERSVRQLQPPDLTPAHPSGMLSALGASVNDTHATARQ